MGIFGWSYPAGCDGTPDDEPCGCEVCGKDVDNCECPECPVCGTHGDLKCYAEHGMTRPDAPPSVPADDPQWMTFTRRTDDPKLAYLERRLDDLGIRHRRNGESFHAPILEVPANDHEAAYALLNEKIDWSTGGEQATIRLDDIPDDDPFFEEG